jgi:TP901 family phage tail tape measure protein
MPEQIIDVFLRFRSDIQAGLATAQAKLDSFSNSAKNVGTAFAPISAAAGLAVVGAVKFGAEWSKASGNAARGLDLAGKELADFEKAAEGLAQKLSFQKSSAEILNLATDIGKLGVAKNDVLNYTEAIVKLATATDSLDKVNELSTNIAKIGNVFKFTSKDVEVFGGALNKLADATAATPNDIVNVTQRLSGIAKQSKLSANEVAAWGATMISAGKTSETTATFYNNFLGTLGAGTNLSKDAQGALKSLGFEASSLAVAFDKNANGTMIKFLETVNKLDSVSQRKILGQIFGKEFSDDAALLATQTENLKNNLKAAGDQAGNIAKVNAEFKAMAENSFEGQLTTMKNQLFEIGKTFGVAILPSIISINKALIPMLNGFAAFAKTNPEFTKIAVIVVGLVALAAPLGFVVSGITSLIASVPVLTGAVTALGVGVTSFLIPGLVGIASAAGIVITGLGGVAAAAFAAILPFTPFIAAAVAVAGAAYLIITNWSKISTFFSGLWSGILTGISNFVASAERAFLNFFAIDESNWNRLKTNTVNILTGIDAAYANFVNSTTSKITTGWNSAMTYLGQRTQATGNFFKAEVGQWGNAFTSVSGSIQKNLAPGFNWIYANLQQVDRAWFSAINYIDNLLQNMYSRAVTWGSNMVTGFVNGIRSKINDAVRAAADMTAAVAQYLPHSPAEKGALSTLDQTGFAFTDTFLSGINKSGIQGYMNNLFTQPKNNLSLTPSTNRNQENNTSSIQLVYSPVITGSRNDADTILASLKGRDKDLLDIIDRASRRLNRRFY